MKSARKTLLLNSLLADASFVLAGLDLDFADDVPEKVGIMLQHRVSKTNMLQTFTSVPGGEHDTAESCQTRIRRA